MRPRVYAETTFISYLAAKPSRDLIVAAHQQLTRDWWESRRDEFELFVSELVLAEASAGNPEAAIWRMEEMSGIAGISRMPRRRKRSPPDACRWGTNRRLSARRKS